MSRLVAIANPMARAGKIGKLLGRYERELRELFPEEIVEIWPTTAALEATTLARKAIEQGVERVAAIGGDGTINEVLNGFFPSTQSNTIFMPIPAGTGGDFSRSIGLYVGKRLTDVFEGASTRTIDVGQVELENRDRRYFINIASFGSSGLVVDRVNSTSKVLGGRMSFAVGTMRGMLGYRNRRVTLRVDDVFEEELLINTVAIANGRYFGGGMKIAPAAQLDDGLFDIIIIGDVGLATYLRHAGKLYRGEHLGLPQIHHLQGKRIVATPVSNRGAGVCIETDGEQPGILPATFTIMPSALNVFAPWRRAEAVNV